MNRYLAATLLIAALCGSPAVAAPYFLTGDTSGAPTFNRPIDNGYDAPTDLSTVGTDVPFASIGFSVSLTGRYDLYSTAGFDNFLGLYSVSFDPAQALANALIYNDDGDGGVGSSGLSFDLNAGTAYFAVVTGYENYDFGVFTLSIDGPGFAADDPAGGAAGAIPEPAAWMLMVTGFGLVGAVARRRNRVVAA